MTGEKLLLDPKEVFDIIGCGDTKGYELLRAGVIPHIRIGRKYKIPKRLLLEWIERQAVRVD